MTNDNEKYIEACKKTFGEENVSVVETTEQALSELAKREARRQYQREWRRNNPDKVKAQRNRYWEKKGHEYIESFSKLSETPVTKNTREMNQAEINQLSDGYVRIIEFRGRAKKDDEWIRGDLYQYLNGAKAIRPYAKTQPISVDSKTVGQYVNRADADGKPMYEGDIVDMSLNGKTARLVVRFCAGAFVLSFKAGMDFYTIPLIHVVESKLKIIGNIHDNPELMEVRHG